MIIELDTSLLDKIENLSINQLVLLTLVKDENQKTNQSVSTLLSRVEETDIQGLIDKNLITVEITENSTIYKPTEKLNSLLKPEKSWFDEFYELFPIYVVRPDGTKGFLRTNVNKCRQQYNRVTGKSIAMHQHIMDCLKHEIDTKLMQGKLGYMKTMWKWLTTCEWEVNEAQMQEDNSKTEDTYGTTIY